MLSKTVSKKPKRIRNRPLKKLASFADRREIDDLDYYLDSYEDEDYQQAYDEEMF